MSIASIETAHTQTHSGKAQLFTQILSTWLALKLIRKKRKIKNQKSIPNRNWGGTGLDLGARPRLRGWNQT